MTQTKPLDLLKSTARTGLRFGRVIGTQVGRAAVAGAGMAREQVQGYAARRRPTSPPIETFVPSPRPTEPTPAATPADTPRVTSTGETASAPTPAEVAKRVARKPAPKAPASKAASKPTAKAGPGGKLPPRRREEPATGE